MTTGKKSSVVATAAAKEQRRQQGPTERANLFGLSRE